jgi:hypothetical protein
MLFQSSHNKASSHNLLENTLPKILATGRMALEGSSVCNFSFRNVLRPLIIVCGPAQDGSRSCIACPVCHNRNSSHIGFRDILY